MITNIIIAIAVFSASKSFLIGSDFSFIQWMRHGENYLDFYFNRPQFDPKKNYKKTLDNYDFDPTQSNQG